MPRDITRFLALAAGLALATSASAAWPPAGKLVTVVDDSFNGIRLVRVMDLPSGEFYVLTVGSGGNANGFSLQRLSPTGDIAPGWPADGLKLGEVSKSETPSKMGFTVDDTGAVWCAAYMQTATSRPSARLARPEPLLMGPWPATSTTGFNLGAAAVPAPGGAYLAFNGKLQRMTRSGTIAPGWPANGVSSLVSGVGIGAVPDGADGVVVFGAGGGPPAAKRFDPSGVLHPGWPTTLSLSSDPDDQMADFDMSGMLVRSGTDHFIAGWSTPGDSEVKRLKLQRFSASGTLDPAWPANGLVAIPPDTIACVTLIPDGLGGVHALWIAHKRPYGVHVRSDGTLEPGTAGGVDLAGGDPSYQVPRFFLSTFPEVIADAAPGGRLIFAYDDFFTQTPQYRVRWLLPDYSADPAEPMRTVNPAARGRSVKLVHHDGVGGAYLGWETSPSNPEIPYMDFELWMTRLLPSSLLGVPPRGDVRLALGRPSPNPARDVVTLSVTLPDDSDARVELLDVAGRVLRTQFVAGAGAHAIQIGELGSLPPGLYFARVTCDDRSTAVRVSVSR